MIFIELEQKALKFSNFAKDDAFYNPSQFACFLRIYQGIFFKTINQILRARL